MSIRIKRRWVLAISCLIITGCEKTVIREVPASSEPEAGVVSTVLPDGSIALTPGINGGSNMVTGGTNTDTSIDADADIDADSAAQTDADQLEDPLIDSEVEENANGTPLLQDPIDLTVDGDPGAGADCDNTLPCRWISDDSQFSVTVTNADNIGSQDRLQLNYTVETLHDTELSVTGGGQAIDGTGTLFKPGGQILGSTISSNIQSLLAGAKVDGTVVFDQKSASTSIAEWSITMLEGGVARVPSFTNIPIGTITTAFADCEMLLPCIWLTPQGNVSITLTSAGGYTTNGRLTTTFTVQSATTIDVVMEAGAFAISSEGTRFDGRTHTLGSSKGGGKLTSTAEGGYRLTGSVEYYRYTTVPTALNEIAMVLYQDSPIPRWNPKFVNVPIQ